ncbi:MAG: lipopolysaccharide heptosyltransferase II [Thermodesulfobacteriota bacterium]|nr:lipopolysaccharide heptosyltransferase II [Thermodesulfobacteriota bacterium]
MKILIVKLSAIGDVVHSLPVLYALRQRFPSAHIAWLVEEAASSLLEGHPLLDRLIVSKRKSWLKALGHAGNRKRAISEIKSFIHELRDTEYDIVLDLHALLKSGLLIFLARGKRKIGYARGDEGSSIFLNEKVPPYDIEEHAILRYMNLARYLGARPNGYYFPISISDADRHSARQILENERIAGPFMAINPIAKWDSKLWDKKRFALLADHCIKELKLPVIFTGGKEDDAAIQSIMEQMQERAVNLCGRTNLRELAHLYSLSRVMVTTDTGPMHIAAAVGTPVVALFGPTAPWRTGPFGDGHVVIRKELPCSPCFKKKCTDPRCMSTIEVEEVLQVIWNRINLLPKD